MNTKFKTVFYTIFWLQVPLYLIPLLVYRLEFNAGFDMAFRYGLLPILAVTFFVFVHYRSIAKEALNLQTPLSIYISILFTSVWFTGLGVTGSLILINCTLGQSVELNQQVRIIDKDVSSSRGRVGYIFKYSEEGKEFSLHVPEETYNQKEIGDLHDIQVKIGSLGIVYN